LSFAKEKIKYWITLTLVLFIVYTILAAQPVPEETILTPRWLSSLTTDYAASFDDAGEEAEEEKKYPFVLGDQFGYLNARGVAAAHQLRKSYVAIAEDRWAEYDGTPGIIDVRDPNNQRLLTINAGAEAGAGGENYPFFLDNRTFLLGGMGNSLSLLAEDGKVLWTYDFAAPLTCIDAASGLILTGSLDGAVELLDLEGRRAFFFEPGGSRLAIILGCRLSADGSHMAVVSGVDDQRFLFLERSGESYKVVYHEFLEDGFRHAVHIAFVDQDRLVAFERQGGLGIYDIKAREGRRLDLPGTLLRMDEEGGAGLLFCVNSLGDRRQELVAVRLPGEVIFKAPFWSDDVFLRRAGDNLFVGGGSTIAAFKLHQR